jgi:hypothetical protein
VATAAELPEPRLRIEPALAIALGVALAVAAAGWSFLRVTPERTAEQTVRWTGPRGEPLPAIRRAWAGCGDERFRGVVDGGRLWVQCAGGPGFEGGALARIDPARGTGEVRWPLPPEPGESERVVAFAPGPGGRVAIVYRVYGGRLLAGVADDRGWKHAPAMIAGESVAAVHWDGEVAEVAVLPRPQVVRIGQPGLRTIAHVDVDDAWFDERSGGWAWMVDGRREVPRPLPSARGVTLSSFSQLTHYPKGSDVGGEVDGARVWIAQSRGVRRLGLAVDPETGAVTQPIGAETWGVRIDRSGPAPWPLEIQRGDRAWRAVGVVHATGAPTLVPAGEAVHVVFDDGEHVAVSSDGARLDPLTLGQHLQRQIWRARLVQLGLPLALLIAFAVARVRRRSAAPAVLVAASTYAVAATLCLIRLAGYVA